MDRRCKDCRLDEKIKKLLVLRFIMPDQRERREAPDESGPVCLEFYKQQMALSSHSDT